MIYLTYLLIAVLIIETLWTIQTSILRAVIGLAATSILLSILLFQMGAPLAAVFELSVCAGLITVVFVSTISLTRPLNQEEEAKAAVERAHRFHPSFVLAALVGLALWVGGYAVDAVAPPTEAMEGVRDILWNVRRLDLIGQIIIMFVGIFGVVVLFKERKAKEELSRASEQVARPGAGTQRAVVEIAERSEVLRSEVLP